MVSKLPFSSSMMLWCADFYWAYGPNSKIDCSNLESFLPLAWQMKELHLLHIATYLLHIATYFSSRYCLVFFFCWRLCCVGRKRHLILKESEKWKLERGLKVACCFLLMALWSTVVDYMGSSRQRLLMSKLEVYSQEVYWRKIYIFSLNSIM